MFRVNQLSKDLGMKSSKELILFLEGVGISDKKSSSVLSADEFNAFFNELTMQNQISDIDGYMNKKSRIFEGRRSGAAKKADDAETAKTKVAETAPDAAKGAEAEKGDVAAEREAREEKGKTKKSSGKTNTEKTEKAEKVEKVEKAEKVEKTEKAEKDAKAAETDPHTSALMRAAAKARAEYESKLAAEKEKKERAEREKAERREREKAKEQRTPRERAPLDGEGGEKAAAKPEKRNREAEKARIERLAKAAQNSYGVPTVEGMGYKNDPRNVKKTKQTQNAGKQRTGVTRVVDTRTTTVDLSKYDDKLDTFAPDAISDKQSNKQKLKKQNTRDARGSKKRDCEKAAEEMKRKAQLEKAKKQPLRITIPDEISVGELASRLKVTASEVIKRLMLMGTVATVNQIIDFDTAFLIADEFKAEVTKEVVVTIEEKLFTETEDSEENLKERAPVVCVMGHVDHGKTSILDAIRHTNVTSGEAGGITQHIGAYTVKVNGRDITFLDTPGHAAFTAMRARGAMATDIAILVVAADDGIMPQTVEAINHAKAAGVEIIVAINKMDKPEANPEAVKSELTNYSLVPEEWGGDVICVPVSAVTGQGLDDLLESILLVAEVKEYKANPDRRAKGVVIESKLDKGRGPVATVLVQNGTLHSGDIVIAGTAVGRVRAMTDDKGAAIKSAGPSVPVEIIGLAEVPKSGDEFNAVEDERMARELAEQRRAAEKEDMFKANAKVSLDDLFAQIKDGVKDLNIIVKADVVGSAEAVKASLEKISNDEVKVKVIHSAAGGITEGDVTFAAASNAIIVGFNVRPDKSALDSAKEQNVDIRTYRVIYECIEEITAAMKGMLAPTYREVLLGHIEVRQTIHVPNVGTIAGSYVQDGKVTRNAKIRVVRDGVVVFEDEISSLRRFKDDVREVAQGYECGIGLEKFNDIKVGDILEAYIMEEVRQ